MVCPKCNNQYPDNWNACPRCGEPSYQNATAQRQQPPITSTPEGGRAVMVFVLGILGLVIPWAGLVTGIIAIVIGSKVKGEFVRNDPRYSLAYAGWIMGIIGVCLQAVRWIW